MKNLRLGTRVLVSPCEFEDRLVSIPRPSPGVVVEIDGSEIQISLLYDEDNLEYYYDTWKDEGWAIRGVYLHESDLEKYVTIIE